MRLHKIRINAMHAFCNMRYDAFSHNITFKFQSHLHRSVPDSISGTKFVIKDVVTHLVYGFLCEFNCSFLFKSTISLIFSISNIFRKVKNKIIQTLMIVFSFN